MTQKNPSPIEVLLEYMETDGTEMRQQMRCGDLAGLNFWVYMQLFGSTSSSVQVQNLTTGQIRRGSMSSIVENARKRLLFCEN